ncbi:FRG domain-containing protein [bacterium]|nr:FRG domain-containing protein [bacterium]
MNIQQNDIIVNSWSELCDRVYDESWREDIRRFRSNYAFRGVSNKKYDLSSSFMRQCGKKPKLEYHLLRNFKKYAEINGGAVDYSDWRWMTIAQHHGLPTRLLDWTYSPFVAMHFATIDPNAHDCDGAIWAVDYVETNRMLPSLLRDVLHLVGANAFTLEMLERAIPEIETFDRLSDEELVMFFEPPSLDARIVNQFAFFSVMSNPVACLHNWLDHHPQLYKRIIIPKALKWEVRDKLDQANITERILFPGLDGLADWLARHYRPVK